jgi:hypothetical protein
MNQINKTNQINQKDMVCLKQMDHRNYCVLRLVSR